MNAGSIRRFAAAVPARRLALGFLASLVLAIGLLAGSIWTESRYVLAPSKSPAVEKVREILTRPVAAAAGRQLQQNRGKLSAAWMRIVSRDRTIEQNIAGLLDENITPQERERFAQRLVRIATPEALAALLRAFEKASPEQKPLFAELLGSTREPSFKKVLLPLLADADERLAGAAIHGLAAIGGDDVTAKLAELLRDKSRTENVRLEAAGGLAAVGTSDARDALIAAFPEFAQGDAATDLLRSLGRFPFEEIGATFRDFLAAPETPRDLRAPAVEALANSSDDALPLLLELAKTDADAEVRAAAAWTISAHGFAALGSALTELAESESDANVRRRLYEAIIGQADLRAAELLPRVLDETDVAARIAGFNALAAVSALDPASPLAVAFDQQIVPELERIAASQRSLNLGLRAVFALRRVQSARAQQALAAIARAPALPQVSAAARYGLLSAN